MPVVTQRDDVEKVFINHSKNRVEVFFYWSPRGTIYPHVQHLVCLVRAWDVRVHVIT